MSASRNTHAITTVVDVAVLLMKQQTHVLITWSKSFDLTTFSLSSASLFLSV